MGLDVRGVAIKGLVQGRKVCIGRPCTLFFPPPPALRKCLCSQYVYKGLDSFDYIHKQAQQLVHLDSIHAMLRSSFGYAQILLNDHGTPRKSNTRTCNIEQQ
ncbi:hypothetical protein OIU74_012595 [Salix koriyanagi]|uniref:Uncharacterized protein n=1 Tax=Salix koriyanagi TaxID=2511006 RepID=A0A9Q0T510_9ROSI|nr:hypothetical protein OIU74_012595 [Salix koriyanagi]